MVAAATTKATQRNHNVLTITRISIYPPKAHNHTYICIEQCNTFSATDLMALCVAARLVDFSRLNTSSGKQANKYGEKVIVQLSRDIQRYAHYSNTDMYIY